MKLLYIWIEDFRNIAHQGIVVDDEYFITVKNADLVNFDYYTDEGKKIIFQGPTPNFDLKVFKREIECVKNTMYHRPNSNSPISSISALIGKNAVGKTSILECMYMQEHEYLIKDDRHYFMAFLNESERYIEIRSRGIHISALNICEKEHRFHDSFIVYAIPVDGFTGQFTDEQQEDTQFVYLSPLKAPKPYVGYNVLDLSTVVGDLDAFNLRNSFCGAFDFFCKFPDLGGRGNYLVCHLTIDDRRHEFQYFQKNKYGPEDYKKYFIYKFAKTVFSNLREYLYHQKPEYMMDGRRRRDPNEEKLFIEDRQCTEILSAFNTIYPSPDSVDLITSELNSIPRDAIEQSLVFFENCTFPFMGKTVYDNYLANLRTLFNQLFNLEREKFTAFYKIELPFEDTYMPLVTAMQSVLHGDSLGRNWASGVNIEIEWLSSGEYHVSMLFSAIYQYIKSLQSSCNCHTIWAIDEPEMHMHPELGRTFVDKLNKAMLQFHNAGLMKSCQFIFATHSPFIVQNLKHYNSNFTLVKKERNQIYTEAFTDIPHLTLPGRTEYSFNLIMYRIFGIPTTELHDELYGELQVISHNYTESAFDAWLNSKGIPSIKQWIYKKGGQQKTQNVTLQTYIRNFIHHPENRLNSQFLDVDLQKSIDQMIAVL